MKELSDTEKARLELEFITHSKEMSKFELNNNVKSFLAVFILIFPFIIAIFLDALKNKNWLLAIFAPAALIIFLVWNYFNHIYPLAIEYRKKHKMFRKRYKTLGINPAELDEELKEINFP